jgi:type IV pilus assembly protein PilV
MPAMPPTTQPTTRRQGGVMLLEALIAILIFSIGILAVVGMQATAMKAVTDARSRSEAALYANQLLAQIWTDAVNADQYAYAGSGTIPARLQGWHDQVTGVAGQRGMPGASVVKPKVTITSFVAGKGGTVKIEVFWRTGEETTQGLPAHNYTVMAAVYGN